MVAHEDAVGRKRDLVEPLRCGAADPDRGPRFECVDERAQLLRSVCERLLDLDEGIQEWRYRHVKMVQRTIGAKTGTGGSAGAAYLMTTLNRPLFPDLWEIRSQL